MPLKPPHPCKTQACSGLALYGEAYCSECIAHGCNAERDKHRRFDKTRGSAASRGYGPRWKKYRAAYVKRHPLCVDPFKRHQKSPQPAMEVDHIIPHKGDQVLFWDHENHQSLCTSCHSHKTALERRG